MLFIDAILIILRLTQLEKSQVEKRKQLDRQPLGVRPAAKGPQAPSKPQPPVESECSPPSAIAASSMPAFDDGLASAERAFHALVASAAALPTAATAPTQEVNADEPRSPANAGVRRRRRAD